MRNQQGITLIGAIFVLIIVSLLGQYLVNLAGVQRQTSILALQSSRAYQAASAGIEWTTAKVVTQTNCPSSFPSTFANTSGFVINLSCTKLGDYDENGVSHSVFRLNSQSKYGNYGELDYVSRALEVTVHVP